MKPDVPQWLRSQRRQIAEEWASAVKGEVDALARLNRGTLVDHIPEVIEGLAIWVEGGEADAKMTFIVVAEGHALQRVGHGIDLSVVSAEYTWLRKLLMQRVLTVPLTPAFARQIITLNEGLDEALRCAVRAYLEQRDRWRDRFIGILGHDLRNPLNTATVASQALLSAGTLDERSTHCVLAISRAAERMTRMVNDVLDFASGQLGGGIPITPMEHDLGDICRAVAAEAHVAHPGRSLQVVVEGQLRACVDHDRAFQALGNLLGNAIQHGRDPLTISAREEGAGDLVTTRVANHGDPIPPALRARLFDPFSQVGAPRRAGSLGLGLYIVAEIARAHGATYHVASSNEETSFSIRWPRRPASRRARPEHR